jgi:3'(2'), 5'-bisphosphate nucleotidase
MGSHRIEKEPTVSSLDDAARTKLMADLTAISVAAAQVILRLHASGVRTKPDGSPVTAADEAAEALIRDRLARLVPGLPIISEEHATRETTAVHGPDVILVDPLDGTRDFIAGRDEYTINIALVSNGTPILGIVTAPALGRIWRGIVGRGAERLEFSSDAKISKPVAIRARPRPDQGIVVMVSRSHLEANTKAYLNTFHGAKVVSSGSAVKFCRLAEGTADHYPRLAPTHDWDVAAGHALLQASGGHVTAPDGSPLVYGTADLIIPGFLAWGAAR